MSVVRVHKNSDYTVMSNFHLKEKNISLKAKGLLSLMLSLPEDWDYSITGLVTLSSDGEASIRSALKELEEFGYLERRRVYENGKIADWEYNIFEKPKAKDLQAENLDVENQQVGFQVVENHGQLNTKKQNTKKQNKKDNSKELLLQENPTTFLGSAKKEPKQSLYSKCVSLINDKTEDLQERKLLIEWLDMLLEKYRDKNKTLYQNVFKGKLNTLDKHDRSQWKEIIEYTIQRGYEAFYPIRTQSIEKPWEEGVTSIKQTKEEKAEMEKWQNEMRKKGVRVDF